MTDIGLVVLSTRTTPPSTAVAESAEETAISSEEEVPADYALHLETHARRETHDSVLLHHEIALGEDAMPQLLIPLGFGQQTRWALAASADREDY